jgi:DNA-binding CsgD family transcriptional regulator
MLTSRCQLALARCRVDPADAERDAHAALTLQVEHELRLLAVESLAALARIAADLESHEEAARLLAAAQAARVAFGSVPTSFTATDELTVVARLDEALGADHLESVWQEGASLSLDDAIGYARRARGERKRPSSGWASLTPTELTVAAYVAEGLSNPQIGERMFIGRGTVKTHVSHIFAKLDIGTRAELAVQAARHHA